MYGSMLLAFALLGVEGLLQQVRETSLSIYMFYPVALCGAQVNSSFHRKDLVPQNSVREGIFKEKNTDTKVGRQDQFLVTISNFKDNK